MGWSAEDFATQGQFLQAIAEYKYDEYQQFSPGMHFTERLSIWMRNFETAEEKAIAYDFVTNRLLFFSEAEMRNLVGVAYPDYIRPTLIQRTARELNIAPYRLRQITESEEFEHRCRESLFLGLSDGARIDLLRRFGGLNNEQVHSSYQISGEKCQDMLAKLRSEVKNDKAENRFTSIFLIDDFSASSRSLLRIEGGMPKGKIPAALNHFLGEAKGLVAENADVYIVLYLATEKAVETLRANLSAAYSSVSHMIEVITIFELPEWIAVNGREPSFEELLKKYYDPSIMDDHLRSGGDDVIYGYAECALPVVLTHNTPNNSVYLIWAEKKNLRTRALFPRVSRHRDGA